MNGFGAASIGGAVIRFEAPTTALLVATYGIWGIGLWVSGAVLPLGIVLAGLAIVQHASLQHEAIHKHPTRHDGLNEALVFPSLILLVPYRRFRDTHLAHHLDANLTDPYDDPESNYLDAADWAQKTAWRRTVLQFNNTLAGRMLIGPALGTAAFLRQDWTHRHTPSVRMAWALHVPAAALVLALLWISPMPFWAYGFAVYGAMSVLRIRTFLEHRAHDKPRARTVIIEDRGPLALLFLNNNYHVVHHMHPQVAWYDLPALYQARKAHYLAANEGYRFANYRAVFRSFFWKRKDPVEHPLWRRDQSGAVVPYSLKNKLSSSSFLKNGTEVGGSNEPIVAATSASTTSVMKGRSSARASESGTH